MSQEQLAQYVKERIAGGAQKADIKEQLVAIGWTSDEANIAYAEGVKLLGAPVPQDVVRGVYAKESSALEVIMNLFSFILLGIVAFALGTLYFQVINKFFPDTLDAYGLLVSSDAVHYAIAGLVIAFPMYFFVMRSWFRKFRENEGKVEAGLTKWITYFVILVVSVIVVGDLIAVLFAFLQGEITARFFLKALTILVIAGGIFGFYFLERRRVQYRQNIQPIVFQGFFWGFLILILIGIVLGFMAVGSPKTERMRATDALRVENLTNLAECIDSYAHTYKRLPETLEDLDTKGTSYYGGCWTSKEDPETGALYEYHILSPSRQSGLVTEAEYELCATFSLASDETIQGGSLAYYNSSHSKWAKHGAGRECDRQIVVIDDQPAK